MARGSNIILLWESHVSLLTMSPFVKDMVNDCLVTESRKPKKNKMIFGPMKKKKEIKDAKITRTQSPTTVICNKTTVAVLYESNIHCD